MATYTQVLPEIITHQAVTNPESVQGTPVSVASALHGVVLLKHAYIEAVDPGGIEPKFHIMGSQNSSGDDDWSLIQTITCVDPGAAPATEAVSGSEIVGSTVIGVASTTGFSAGNRIYIRDTTTEGNSEWHLIDRVVANTSIDIFYGLTNAKDSADVIWGSAEQFFVPLDFSGLSRINVLYSNEGSSAPDTAIHAAVDRATAIG